MFSSGDWVVDSGAMCHISSNLSNLESLDWSRNGQEGKVVCMLNVDKSMGIVGEVRTEDVMFIRSFHGSLLSVKKKLATKN